MSQDANSMDRLPPHNRDAERSLLGSMLRDNAIIAEAVNLCRADDFYVFAHQKIFEAVTKLNDDAGKPADIVTVAEWLSQAKLMEEIGGPSYLAELWDAAPSAAHYRQYAEIIRQKAIARNLIHACTELSAEAYDQSQPASELLDNAERRILEIAELGITGDTVTLHDAIKEAWTRLDQRKKRGDHEFSGIPTGFLDLDNLTAGFQANELIVLAARPSVGKCLAWDSEIVQDDGSIATMQEIFQRKQVRLLTLDLRWKFQATSPSAFVDDGVKPVFRVTTALGRTIETTLSHPFMTIDGWRQLAELNVGVQIAVPRRIDIFGKERLRECEVRLLGLFLGDGGLTDSTPEFTNNNPRIQKDFEDAIADFGRVKARRDNSNGTRAMSFSIAAIPALTAQARTDFGRQLRSVRLQRGVSARKIAATVGVSPALMCLWEQGKCAPAKDTFSRLCATLEVAAEDLAPLGLDTISKNAKNAVTRWLDSLGLWGKKSADKFIPPIVFRLERKQLAIFLNRLFATDGWASRATAGNVQVGFCSVSEKMIRQVQHLLLRFGIISAVHKRAVKYKDQLREAWQLAITDQHAIQIFADQIGMLGKEESLANVLEAMNGRNYQTNRDLIPRSIWTRIEAAKGEQSWASVGRAIGIETGVNLHVGQRDISRRRLLELANALGSSELRDLAESEVYWDKIVAIEPVGDKQVYDLTIPETHNFVANDICVHNTAFALNIARHVVVEEGLPVLFVSLEQARVELAERLLCCQARVDSHRIRRGHLDHDDMSKIMEAGDILGQAKLFIDDTPGQSMLRIAANARRLKKRHDLRMVIIDYLQLIDPDDKRDSRQEQVAAISRRLKFLARELKLPVVALAQVNRSSEDRQDHRPRLSDLRESGAIEQDADTVLMLHRPDYHEPGKDEGSVEVIIAKQRNGPTGEVGLMYVKQYMRFENFALGHSNQMGPG